MASSDGCHVRVWLPHGSVLITVSGPVLITVSGPVVPGEGLPYQATADTATWTVTMSHATGTVPVTRTGWTWDRVRPHPIVVSRPTAVRARLSAPKGLMADPVFGTPNPVALS